MNPVNLAALLSAQLLLQGCYYYIPAPHVKTASPQIRGKIVDATTGRGISGATVQLTTHGDEHPRLGKPVLTDADGRFHFAKRFYFFPVLWVGGRGFESHGNDWNAGIRVSKSDYTARFCEWQHLYTWPFFPGPIDLGEVKLSKTKPSQR